MSHSSFRKQKYFGSLDGLRCLSILAVVWFHAAGSPTALGWRGALGVDLFFVISGFLITTLLLRERDENGAIWLGGFYARRVLRIFPLYYTVVFLYLALVLVLERHTVAGGEFLSHFKYFVTYTTNWFVSRRTGERVIFYFAWSLATEEQFYLMWPLVLRLVPGLKRPALLVFGLLVFTEVARQKLGEPVGLAARVITSVAPAICLGCLSALTLHSKRGYQALAFVLSRWWSAPLVLAILAAIWRWPNAPLSLFGPLFAMLVIACVIRPDNGLAWLMDNRLTRELGALTYAMYLLHMLGINVARRFAHEHGGPLVFALGFPAAVLLAFLANRVVERPFLQLKGRIRRKAPSKASPAFPAVAARDV